MNSYVTIYEPSEDWAGIGYKHWMICHQWGDTSDASHSGVGRTLDEAWRDFKEWSGLCGIFTKDDAVAAHKAAQLQGAGGCPVMGRPHSRPRLTVVST